MYIALLLAILPIIIVTPDHSLADWEEEVGHEVLVAGTLEEPKVESNDVGGRDSLEDSSIEVKKVGGEGYDTGGARVRKYDLEGGRQPITRRCLSNSEALEALAGKSPLELPGLPLTFYFNNSRTDSPFIFKDGYNDNGKRYDRSTSAPLKLGQTTCTLKLDPKTFFTGKNVSIENVFTEKFSLVVVSQNIDSRGNRQITSKFSIEGTKNFNGFDLILKNMICTTPADEIENESDELMASKLISELSRFTDYCLDPSAQDDVKHNEGMPPNAKDEGAS